MSENGAMLELEEINTFYGRSHVLHDVSLEVDEGETIALIGRNGAGKTTTLRSIMGVPAPRSGRITYRGEDITAEVPNKRARRGIGIVPENRRVFESLSVHENLIAATRSSEHRSNIDEVYEMFPRLEERRDQDASTLSGGEQQMLSIGRVLVPEPDLLLIDEPTEGLMPTLVEQVQETIVELNESGHTILLVEQNARIALEISDHAFIIDNGEIPVSRPSEDLRDDHETLQRYLSV